MEWIKAGSCVDTAVHDVQITIRNVICAEDNNKFREFKFF
jgi:hypothetical protein